MASVKGLEGFIKKNDYAISNGTYTIAKYYNGTDWVYRISTAGKFIGGTHDSAKKALQSLSDGA